VSKQLEPIHETMTALYRTPMGAYLKQTYNYVAVSKESDYVKDHEHEQVAPNEDAPYLFVYPFIKTREWYLQPFEQRMRMMKEHIAVGHEFPKVTINTSYSFGIDDQDFVVAFDGHNLEEFVKLVMKLRETEGSRYTECDKPMFIGMKKPIDAVLESLGI
jgi:chlorite dismutase